MRISRKGVLTAFVVYFKLHLDDDEANDYSSGPADRSHTTVGPQAK